MSDDSVDPAGSLPAPEPAVPSLPTLPTLPSAAPRAPVAPLANLWDGDREASDMARRTDAPQPGAPGAPVAPADAPLTQAGSVVHRYSAKELAEASRIKAVDNPAYGDLPKANAESQARADDLRRKAAKTRARNKRVGWYMAMFGIVLVLGIFAVAFVLFQQEEDNNDVPVEPTTSLPVVVTVPPGDGATPLGEQVTVISGLEVINQAPVAGGAAATDLINDANEVVANLNGTTAP